MNVLALVHNKHAVSRMARKNAPAAADSGRLKPEWIDPVDALETRERSRAQSLLCGQIYRDCSRNPGPLTLDQAHDVLAWAIPRSL